jgi:transposase InsO family protein
MTQVLPTTSFTCCAHDHFVGSCARPLRAKDALRPPACGPALAGSGRRSGHILACGEDATSQNVKVKPTHSAKSRSTATESCVDCRLSKAGGTRRRARKCEPLTVRDQYSRYILSIQILEKGNIYSVKKHFEALFKKYGLPEIIRSDNGSPFASAHSLHGLTRLSTWWMSLGISLDRTDPGRPDQNGAHERMHADIYREIESKVKGDLKMHQSVFDEWREEFNTERPHESLDMKMREFCKAPPPSVAGFSRF